MYVIASPIKYGEGEWTTADYGKEDGIWRGSFEQVDIGLLIDHNRYTKRTSLEDLIAK